MDSFDFQDVKAEKATAMLRYNRLRTLTKLFRVVEFCVALVLLSWTFNWLPIAVKISGEFFRQLGGVISSSLFVFMVCNAIIVTLIVKSGRFSGDNPSANNAASQLYEGFVKNSPKSLSENPSLPATKTTTTTALPHDTEEIEFQDKEIISQVNVNGITHTSLEDNEDNIEVDLYSNSDSDSDLDTPKVYRRTKSEKVLKPSAEIVKAKLRRSETENCRKMVKSAENQSQEDEMTDEDFQRTVEEFIAKHLMFRRQESLAIVHSISEIEAK